MKTKWLLLLSLYLVFGCGISATAMEKETDYAIKSVSSQYVSVEYPVLGQIDDYDQNIIDAVNKSFADTADEYLESEQAAMEEDASALEEYNPDAIQYLTSEISCTGVYLEGSVYSVAQYYYYYSGGTHGYGMSVGTTYDLETGDEMTMAELLGCDEEAAQEAIVDAYRVSVIGQVENITEESVRGCFESMQYWMTEEGLRVSIPTYMVASYAAGPQEVTVTPEMAAAASEKLSEDEGLDSDVTVIVDGGSQNMASAGTDDSLLVIDGTVVGDLSEDEIRPGQ